MSWVYDPSHSVVEFSAKHMLFTTVRGRFARVEARLDLDEERPERSSAEVTIDASSITTGDANRDGHLRSADFLDVERYPMLSFRSNRVERAGDNRYRVHGELTIRDVTRPLVLEVTSEGYGQDPWGNRRWALNAHTAINRKDYGLTWNVALESGGWLVGDEIKIALELQLIQQAVAEKVA
jgi:polyisoprenoid-binding protein YceI